ncbi:MAG: DUF917 domain-containing protein [Spirochaetia bacterium]
MRKINADDIEAMAIGAAVLGTGGGGDPYIGKLIAQRLIKKYGPITILEPDEVKDTDLCASVYGMGAPSVGVEKIMAEGEEVAPLLRLEKYLGKNIDVIYPIECGGMNSMVPFIVSAQTGKPIADIDGMGRAFPELQMTTFHIFGHTVAPLVMGDAHRNLVIMETVNDNWAEHYARAVTVKMGGQASMADTVLSGKDLKNAGVHKPLALAQKIGQTIISANQQNQPPTQALLEVCEGFDLFYGKVIDILRSTDGAFVRGVATLEGLSRDKGKTLKLSFQNENLMAEVDGKMIASVPDLICNVDMRTGIPITTEGIKFGQRMMVLGIKGDPKLRSRVGLETVGPRAFGYDFDYRPIEDIWRHT